jgi:hypothetical protein
VSITVSPGDAPSQKEVWFSIAQSTANQGTYRVQNIGGTGSGNMNGLIPLDFTNLVSIEAIGFNVAATVGPGADIDLTTEYGAVDVPEARNQHTQTDAASTYTIPAVLDFFKIDISALVTAPDIAAGDAFGLNIDHNSIGGAIGYLGVRLLYT